MFPPRNRIKKGIKDPKKIVKYVKERPIYTLENMYLYMTSRFPIGTHVLDKEWDLLIILDTCRFDALNIIADEFDFIDDVSRIWSLGGTSPEWIAHTFDQQYDGELSKTAYITANPHAETVFRDEDKFEKQTYAECRFHRWGDWNPVNIEKLAEFDPVFKYSAEINLGGINEQKQSVPPRYITDRAIDVGRNVNPDRMILHYMQPHYPWVSNAIKEGRKIRDWERNPNKAKKVGRDKVFDAYLDDLRYVLTDIEILLNNVDAEDVVISADHGDAFGEWRMYGHDPGRFHPKVRFVPWATTTASDKHEYEPKIKPHESTYTQRKEQLEALGYI